MNKLLTLLIFSALTFTTSAQLVITEIMYNPPESGRDSLEYIEIYNNSNSDLDMDGYTFSEGIVFQFADFTLGANEYIVVCVDTAVLEGVMGIEDAFQWESGGLSNGGEDIAILDAQGNLADIVDYENGGDWPSDANGNGPSLELCDVNRDNNDASNWKASNGAKGIVINGNELKGSPSIDNGVSCADQTIMVRNNFFDPDTVTINVGETVEWVAVEGRHNVNGSAATFPNNPEPFFSGGAQQAPWTFTHTFTTDGVYDYRCDPHALLGMIGHVIVLNDDVAPIVITEVMYNDPGGDSLEFVEIFNASDIEIDLNGYRMINAVSHEFQNVLIPEQSYLVLAGNKAAVDQAFGIQSIQLDDGILNNSGEAIEILDNQNRSVDRVVYSSTSPWDTRANGNGHSLILCDVLSDNADPANWSASTNATGIVVNNTEIMANPGDADECEEFIPDYPFYSIDRITTIDAGGLPDSLDQLCAIQGIVHGVDLQGNQNILFTIIDQTGGIAVFSEDNFNYTVQEGDELLLKGAIKQFSGLTQMIPDSLRILSQGNAPFNPRPVTELNESTESEVIVIDELVDFVDPTEWDETGEAFTAQMRGMVTGNTYAMRVDDDTEMIGMMRPDKPFRLSGIGGQFDANEPFDEGYQILPRYWPDFDFGLNTNDSPLSDLIVSPVPFTNHIKVMDADRELQLTLMDLYGKVVKQSRGETIYTKELSSGAYILEISDGQFKRHQKVIKD